jgi:hypothetical protein
MKAKQILLFIVLQLASCFISFSLFAQIPTSGLVAYWPMNGNFNDAGPNAIHGTNAGATATTNKFGAASSAMNFSNPGSTVPQYATHPINAALNFTGTQNFTISLLAYASSPYVHAGGFYDNGVNSGGPAVWFWSSPYPEIRFNYKNGSIGVPNGSFSLGTWYHITCVRDNGALKTYVNGILKATGTEGTQTPSYPLPARFGTMYYSGFSPPEYNGLNGKIDELRIYNRALSAGEIAGLASTTLPLVLTDLSAVKNSSGVILNWKTYNEQNASHFEIERSSDGNNYTMIGRVNAAGNSQDTRLYHFTDNTPLTGTGFYRLRMVDIDNKFSYSRVVAVTSTSGIKDLLQLFPNPVTDVLQLQLQSDKKETATLSITTIAGQVILQRELQLAEGSNAFSIPVKSFQSGHYYVTIHTSSGRQTLPFIKNQ